MRRKALNKGFRISWEDEAKTLGSLLNGLLLVTTLTAHGELKKGGRKAAEEGTKVSSMPPHIDIRWADLEKEIISHIVEAWIKPMAEGWEKNIVSDTRRRLKAKKSSQIYWKKKASRSRTIGRWHTTSKWLHIERD